MKTLVSFVFLLTVGLVYAQDDTSFFSKYFQSDNSYQTTSLDEYSVFKKNFASLIPKGVDKQRMTFSDDSFLQTNQVVSPGNTLALDSGPYLGNATVQSIRLLNTDAKSTYIFDMNGNLRSSQMSFSFGKKKN